MKTYQGALKGRDVRAALIVSRFNQTITERLLEGAIETLTRCGVASEDLTVIRVPGGFELPVAAREAARTESFDLLVCLGCVIRGETPHFDYISSAVSHGLAQVSTEYGLPVGFGVLTCDSVEQAINRAGLKYGNKGEEAALSALETLGTLRSLRSQHPQR